MEYHYLLFIVFYYIHYQLTLLYVSATLLLLSDYLLVGNGPSVHALQAARSMHIACKDYDPAVATTPLHQCKIVTLVRLQNVLSGQTSLQ